MKERRVTVEIDERGRIAADAEGFSGDACLEELEKLLEAVAAGPGEVRRKADPGVARATRVERRVVTVGRKA